MALELNKAGKENRHCTPLRRAFGLGMMLSLVGNEALPSSCEAFFGGASGRCDAKKELTS